METQTEAATAREEPTVPLIFSLRRRENVHTEGLPALGSVNTSQDASLAEPGPFHPAGISTPPDKVRRVCVSCRRVGAIRSDKAWIEATPTRSLGDVPTALQHVWEQTSVDR